jgi:hypothetical protein
MVFGARQVSDEAQAQHAADVELAGKFTELLEAARVAEAKLRQGQADRVPITELHALGKGLDAALTDVMRAAFAAERAEIGARGYDDPIFRRKAKATAPVKAWTAEAEALLTLREAHRLGGIVRVPPTPAA